MQADPNPWTTEELLSQAQWLGALARRLVADPNDADDVLQETWAVALRAPPKRDRALRPWLAQVARNFARMRRRSEGARSAREAAIAKQERGAREVPAAAELSARLEAQHLLVDALRELREPYRATVLLAYFEHQTSEQIAARQGVSAGTVRWRLKSALDELRQRLDSRRGDREGWLLALAPLTRSNSAATATSPAIAWQGALWMSGLLKITVGAAALVGALVWVMRTSQPESKALAPLSNVPVAVEFVPLLPQSSGERAAVETPAATNEASSSRAAAGAAESSSSVEVRVVDERRAPLAGIEITLSAGADRTEQRTRSDADGRARFELASLPAREAVELVARGVGRVPARASVFVEPDEHIHAGTLVLAVGGDIAGRVVDARGAGLAGVVVVLDELVLPQVEVTARRELALHVHGRFHAVSDTDGAFEYRGAPVGMTRVAAGLDGFYTTFSAPIEVRANQCSRGVELTLERLPTDATIAGVVLDTQGAPLPYAKLAYSYTRKRGSGMGATNTDERGRFRLSTSDGAVYALVASDPQGRFGVAQRDGIEPGAIDLELVLTPLVQLEVVARTRTGEPIEHFQVRATDPQGRIHGGASGDGPHADGRVSLVPSLQEFVLEVRAQGFALGRAGPFTKVPSAPLELVLNALPGVRGRVSHRSVGVAGARIEAYRRGAGHHEKNGFAVRFDPQLHESTSSDGDGAFELTLRESGDHTLLLIADGFATAELELDDFEPSAGRSPLDFELVRGGAIEGWVTPEHGGEAAGVVVAFSRGDGRAFTQRVGADGRFRAEQLAPGRWEVRSVAEELSGRSDSTRSWPRGSVTPPWNCEVANGATTRFDLGLRGGEASTQLAARVLVDGAPAAGWRLALQIGSLGQRRGDDESRSLNKEGRARLSTNESGPAALVLTAIGGELDGMRYVRRLELTPGVMEIALELRTATLRIESATVEPPLGVVWLGAPGEFALHPVRTPGESQIAVLAGELKLWRYDEGALDTDPRRWPALDSTRVAPGQAGVLRQP